MRIMKVKNTSNLDFVLLSNGLVVSKNEIVGVQPNPDKVNEYYVHTTTAQYYKINESDYKYLVNVGLGLNLEEDK